MDYPMKVLFLDIDGVLVTSNCEWNSHRKCHELNPNCVAQLKRVIAETGCTIVVSSSWRKRGERWITQFLNKFGIVVHDITGDSNTRGNEILEWVANNPVTKFIAVDDDVFDMDKVTVVQTTWTSGLDQEVANDLISFLKD